MRQRCEVVLAFIDVMVTLANPLAICCTVLLRTQRTGRWADGAKSLIMTLG